MRSFPPRHGPPRACSRPEIRTASPTSPEQRISCRRARRQSSRSSGSGCSRAGSAATRLTGLLVHRVRCVTRKLHWMRKAVLSWRSRRVTRLATAEHARGGVNVGPPCLTVAALEPSRATPSTATVKRTLDKPKAAPRRALRATAARLATLGRGVTALVRRWNWNNTCAPSMADECRSADTMDGGRRSGASWACASLTAISNRASVTLRPAPGVETVGCA